MTKIPSEEIRPVDEPASGIGWSGLDLDEYSEWLVHPEAGLLPASCEVAVQILPGNQIRYVKRDAVKEMERKVGYYRQGDL